MSKVFLLNHDKTPLNPVNSGRARVLLNEGKAAVFRTFPFAIILKEQIQFTVIEPLRLKLDPGSKTTGIAIVNDGNGEVVFGAELSHRGARIKLDLEGRNSLRKGRRSRNTRYRPARFLNRVKSKFKGWLAPSLMSRIHNIETWVRRLSKFCPIRALSQELVKFDTQIMENPEISGVEYQQGTLYGYEVREYLLEKWGRKCAYCGKTNIPLEIEHVNPKAKGGSNRVSNLTIACHTCNQKKGTKTAAEFGHPTIQAKAKQPLKDAAAVNSTRWKLFNVLKETGLELEVGSGGLTKFNRSIRQLSKTHWLDAACVGLSTPKYLRIDRVKVLKIAAYGWGTRQLCQTNKFGFPIRHRTNKVSFMGFRTGDIVKGIFLKKKQLVRTQIGRLTIRQSPQFKLDGNISINHKNCTILQRKDGYAYSY